MALARVKVWIPGDILTAADLNAEFNNIINNPIALISPTTGTITFSTGQTFPLGQVVATSGVTGSVISGSTASGSPLVAGTVIIPGTAALQFNSTTQLQLGLGVLPLKVGTQWVQRAIPTAVTLSATSTDGSTGAFFSSGVFYVYAYDSTGATNLIFATTGAMPHSPSTENGTEVATTDATRALVGLVRMNASTQFSHTNAERFVQSWYNRVAIRSVASHTTNRSIATTSFSEVSTDIRNEFVIWSSQTAIAEFNGTVAAQGPATQLSLSVVFDSSNTNDAQRTVILPAFAGNTLTVPVSLHNAQSTLAEGYHYVTLTALTITTSAGSTGTIFSRQGSAGDAASIITVIV